MAIPLAALFSKSDAASVKVSPLGKYIAWLARWEGVLNLYVAPLPLPAEDHSGRSANSIPGAQQLTASSKRDICFHYTFTHDDKHILYVRETEHGSELYHLYSIKIEEVLCSGPISSGYDLLAEHPQLTCCVGFVGGLQLWLPQNDPSLVVLATGKGSLLWDLSALDLRHPERGLSSIASNVTSTKAGIASLVIALLAHLCVGLLVRLLDLFTLGVCASLLHAIERRFAPDGPSAAVQYFVDRDGELIGTASAAITLPAVRRDGGGGGPSLGARFIPEVALRFTKRHRRRWPLSRVANGYSFVAACPDVPFRKLNMQLVGSGGAQGKMRFEERADGAVALHACDTADTTAWCVHHDALGRTPPTILAHDPRGDIDGFLASPRTGNLEAILITHARTEVVPLNGEGIDLARALERVRAAVALVCSDSMRGDSSLDLALEILPASRTLRDDVWVVRADGDCMPSTFYLLSQPRDAGSVPRELLCARPALRGLPLAWTEAVVVTARDGEQLPAYLTRPRGVAGEAGGGVGRLPLVLVIHGGPNARDYAGFDPVTQLLAARGMAVLTVNYRGSTGFGSRFYNLAIGNVKGMHEDVEDARQWAVSSGIADASRIAIVGASWGGYLALGGATEVATAHPTASLEADASTTPGGAAGRYAAVVAIVPLVAVGACNTSPAFRSDPLVRQYWNQLYGPAVAKEHAAGAALSPLHRLDRLDPAIQLLLVHGERDPRVPREHADAVAAEVMRRGIRGAHLTYAAEGHSIRREPNVLHLWHRVERFLCRALELPEPPALDPALTEKHTATVHWDSVGVERSHASSH